MSNYAYVPVTALCCYAFLLFAFMAAKKNKLTNSFMLVLFSSILWVGGSFCMRMLLWPGTDFWYNISIFGLMTLSFSFFNFAYAFTGSESHFMRRIWLVVFLVIGGLNAFTGVFLAPPEMVPLAGGGFNFVYTFTWRVSFLFLACALMLGNMLVILIRYGKQDALRRRQFTPIMAGVLCIFFGQMGIMLPFFHGFPVDIVSGVVNVACMFYALYRRHLFKLTLLVSKGSCYAIAALLSVAVFSYAIRPIQHFIETRMPFAWAQYDVILIALVFMAFTVGVYYVMKRFIDRVFIKDEILRADTLKEFSHTVSRSLRIDEILEEMVAIIQKTIPVRHIYVCLCNHDGSEYTTAYSSSPLDRHDFTLKANNPIVSWLSETNECLLMSDFRRVVAYKSMWEGEKRQFESRNIECVVPIQHDGSLIGIVLLSGKERNAHFNYDDISFLASVNSISSIAVKNSKLYEKAFMEARTDELTGLLNRKYFYEVLQEEYDKAPNDALALVIINIDDFKLYNQLYGNKEGDLALQAVARIIKASVGQNGFVSRYSGKEFAIILPGYDTLRAKTLAETIRRQILAMNKCASDYALKVLTVSSGICAIPYAASNIKQLVDNADMAVFQVKRNGKNAIMVYSAGVERNDKDARLAEEGDMKESVYSGYASTIYALTAAIDTKDHYTFNHSKNVAYYASALAAAYGMNQESIEIVREAALLHDIGKIGVPEHILNKPGRLTEEEFEAMKQHVENSVGIIRHLPSLDYVIPAVIGHHERVDGKGYPRRISGEDIPLSARILCIADSFDAMISLRAYKQAYPVSYALQEMEAQAGRQFDRRLVMLFIQLVQDGTIRPIIKETEQEA